MRTVYVDVLIVVNVFIDLLLLLCTKRLLHLRARLWRLILAAVLGGFLSLSALLPPLPLPLNLLLDLVTAALLVLAAFGRARVMIFCKRTLTLFAISFGFCGIMVFLYSVFRPQGMAICNNVVYFHVSPFLLIIFTLICYYVMLFFQKMFKGSVGSQLCSVTVRRGGTEATFSAMVDTACHVTEPFSGEPVIIAEKSCLPEAVVSARQKRVIPFESLGGTGMLEGVRVDYIAIDGRKITDRVFIGVCDGVLRGDVRAIVPFSLLKPET